MARESYANPAVRKKFEELVNDKGNRLKLTRLACDIVKDAHEAQDVVQESYVKAINRLSRVRKISSMNSWLCRIVVNTSKDYVRKRTLERKYLARPINLPPEERKGVVTCGKNARDILIEEEEEIGENDGSIIKRAIRQLSLEHRITMNLFYFERKKIREIAEILAIPEGTVGTRLKYAREHLGKILLEMGMFREKL